VKRAAVERAAVEPTLRERAPLPRASGRAPRRERAALECRAQGFSLVELMVAVTLALVVTAGVIAVFVSSRNAYQATSGVAAVSDGGRLAVNLIGQDVRNAGYIACSETIYPWWSNTAADSLIEIDQLNGAAGSLGYDFQHGIGGYEARGTGPAGSLTLSASPAVDDTSSDWTPALDPTFTSNALVPPPTQVYGSDILVLRSSLQATPAYLTANIVPGSTSMTVNAIAGLQSGQIAAVSDCTKAVVFQIGPAPAGTPGLVNVVLAGGPGSPGNIVGANIPLPFQQGSLVTPLTTTIYYIGKGSDGDSALKRLTLNAPNAAAPGAFMDQEVVPDIENMQVLYGVTAAGSGSYAPTQYLTADQVAATSDFRLVVSVKVALLAASPPGAAAGPVVSHPPYFLLGTAVTAPADNRQRQVYEVTFAVRNQMP